ncbi:MAG: response regulator [Pirellulales bacterium]
MANSAIGTVLIVEDDAGVAYLQSRCLERAGYHVVTATTADEAMERLRLHGDMKLVVLDYCLPGAVTGLDLHAQLKAAGYDLPVIMVTAFTEEATVIRALRAGVRDFVSKSAEYLDYLPAAVQRVLEQATLERRLAESEARFQLFMDNSPAVAFIKDEQGRLVYANKRFEHSFNRTDWLGKSDSELWPAETARQLRENDAAVLSAGLAAELVESTLMPDGRVRHWLSYKFPIRDDSGQRLLGGMAIDVTERKEAEAAVQKRDGQLRQAQKMEAIGTLAGGVAHEFNNLLQAVQGYTRYAMEGLEAQSQPYQDLEQVLKAADRAAMLTKQLLGFGRRQEGQFIDVQPNLLVQELLKMIRPLIGENITVKVVLGTDVATVHADPGHLQQVLMNLCVNARDAMPEGGTLLVKTENLVLGDSRELYPGMGPGRYLALTVADTGCGIAPEHKDHIFEPFFTSKEVGKGTGLGLAVAYGIVQGHGGVIRVYSELGLGSTFKVYLPAVGRDATIERPDCASRPAGGIETILVAEDEPMVRDLTVRTLQSAGYQTLTAQDGEEAVDVFRRNADKISLALLDVVMPRLSGRQVYQRIKEVKPAVQVLFCSGYDPHSGQADFIANDGLRLVQKPIAPDVLLQTIREVLDQEAACQAT